MKLSKQFKWSQLLSYSMLVHLLSTFVVAQEIKRQPVLIKQLIPTEMNQNCTSREQYERFWQEVGVRYKSEPVRTQSAVYPLLDWPFHVGPGNGITLGNYVDEDPTSGQIDYTGGPRAYNGHDATDMGLNSFRDMDRGVPILAAAEGVVAEIVYHRFDRNIGSPGQEGADNHVVVRHADGTYAWYQHLRKNSIPVNVGETVYPGDTVGLTGSSGSSSAAHLHFAIGEYINGVWTRRDPWYGTNQPLPSLWKSQLPYMGTVPLLVYDMDIFTQTAVGGDIGNIPPGTWQNRPSAPAVMGINEPIIPIWLFFQGRFLDSYHLEILRSNNTAFASVDYTIPGEYQATLFYYYWYFSCCVSSADYGTWRVKVTSGGQVIKEVPFEVGPTTIFAPRFWPIAGRSFRTDGTVQRETLRVSSLGSSVTYHLINLPSFVSLENDSIVIIGTSPVQLSRSVFFQAVATDGFGRTDTAWYHVVNPTAETAPSIPEELWPMFNSIVQPPNVSVVWSRAARDSLYHVQFSANSSFTTLFHEADVYQDTTYTTSSLPDGVRYWWRVRATNSYGSSSYSQGWPFKLALMTPESLSATQIGSGTVLLQWKDRSSSETTFSILRRSNSDSPYTFVGSVAANETTLTDSNVENDSSYSYRVYALNSVVTSDSSEAASITLNTAWPPSVPVLVSPSVNQRVHYQNIALSWNKASIDSLYALQVANDSLFSDVEIDVQTEGDTSFTVGSLPDGKRYWWRVSASNSYGNSGYSAKWSFITQIATPESMSATESGIAQFLIAWKLQTSNAESVIILRRQLPQSSYLRVGSIAAVETCFTDNVPHNPLGFGYRVYAKNGVTTSDTSAETIASISATSVLTSFSPRWNLVSVPVSLASMLTLAAFPTASSSAYAYTGTGYSMKDTLELSEGYWLKFDSTESLDFVGWATVLETLDVDVGWNLVGSLTQPIAVNQIGSDPAGIITSEFYGYDGGYVRRDTIKPGMAYWVRVSTTGKFILDGQTAQPSQNRIHVIPTREIPPGVPGSVNAVTEGRLPDRYALEQNYPNPFNPLTVIRYSLPVDSWVTLKMYTILGDEVATLVDEMQDAGYKSVAWDAAGIASGIYTYRLIAGTYIEVKKMLLMK